MFTIHRLTRDGEVAKRVSTIVDTTYQNEADEVADKLTKASQDRTFVARKFRGTAVEAAEIRARLDRRHKR